MLNRNETNVFHLEIYSHINRRAYDTQGDPGLWGHVPTAQWESWSTWMQTDLSCTIDSLWPWADYFTFLTFSFLRMKRRTLTATLEFPVMLPLTCQLLSIVSLAWNILPPNFSADSYTALGLSLNALASPRKAILPPQDGIRFTGSRRCFLNSCLHSNTFHINGNILLICSALNRKFINSKGSFFYQGHPSTSEVIGTAAKWMFT